MIGRLMGWIMPSLTPVLLALLAGAILLAGVQTVRFHQKTTELAEFRAFKINSDLAREQEYASNRLSVQKTEHALIALADQARKEKHEATQKLDRRVADLLERLRLERAERPIPSPGQSAPDPSSGAGCTGAGLYRPDGEFLVGFAASATLVGIERDACIAAYTHARQALSATP